MKKKRLVIVLVFVLTCFVGCSPSKPVIVYDTLAELQESVDFCDFTNPLKFFAQRSC